MGWRDVVIRLLTPANTEAQPASPLIWESYPDPQREGATIYEAQMNGGNYIIVQEVSAGGVWGWLLMSSENNALEMRNGFDSKEKAQKHVTEFYFGKAPGENGSDGDDGGPRAA